MLDQLGIVPTGLVRPTFNLDCAGLLAELDSPSQHVLDKYGFDERAFEANRQWLAENGADPSRNWIDADVEPPVSDDITPLPPLGSSARHELADRGNELIAAGAVGLVVLAGGMATRFGGVVKALSEAVDGRTFLDLKVADAALAARNTGTPIPVFFMTSFATHDAVRMAAGQLRSDDVEPSAFAQMVSLRLTEDGSLFRGAGGLSLYAPGHGDLPEAIQRSGLLDQFGAGGGRYLLMSNVDNPVASLDPAIIGLHDAGGADVTVEVTARSDGFAGGAPARVNGHLEVVEGFRFPPGFDQNKLELVNTNTLVLSAGALSDDIDLSWFMANKTVEGRAAVQFERLVGQITATRSSQVVEIDSGGHDGRFQPAKDPNELQMRRPEIRSILADRGIIGS